MEFILVLLYHNDLLCISELLDATTMRSCNAFSNLNYKEAPTLFLEFHGSPKVVEEDTNTVGMSRSLCDWTNKSI